jgi:hypothetical protein
VPGCNRQIQSADDASDRPGFRPYSRIPLKFSSDFTKRFTTRDVNPHVLVSGHSSPSLRLCERPWTQPLFYRPPDNEVNQADVNRGILLIDQMRDTIVCYRAGDDGRSCMPVDFGVGGKMLLV